MHDGSLDETQWYRRVYSGSTELLVKHELLMFHSIPFQIPTISLMARDFPFVVEASRNQLLVWILFVAITNTVLCSV